MRCKLSTRLSTLLITGALALSTACAPADEAAPEPEAPAVASEGAETPAADDILADPARPDEERVRDTGSKPLELFALFGIEPGMTVVDLMPGRGYNSHILAKLVGDDGHVLAGPDRRGRMQERIDTGTLPNVEVFDDYEVLQPDSIDAMITIRNIHDLENRGGAEPTYATWLAALKPGGVLGVVDARTDKEGIDESTHRVNEELIVSVLTAAGFELVERSDLLAVEGDDYDSPGEERWAIDRFTLKFRRPAQ